MNEQSEIGHQMAAWGKLGGTRRTPAQRQARTKNLAVARAKLAEVRKAYAATKSDYNQKV